MRNGSSSSSSQIVKAKYRSWSADEGEKIQDLFKDYIINDVTPPLQKCAAAMHLFPNRDRKNIQDKVKTYHKQFNK